MRESRHCWACLKQQRQRHCCVIRVLVVLLCVFVGEPVEDMTASGAATGVGSDSGSCALDCEEQKDESEWKWGSLAGTSRKQILLIGDSLTEQGFATKVEGADDERKAAGWTTLLSEFFGRHFDVINFGLSGYNTRWIRYMIDKKILLGAVEADSKAAEAVVLVTIFLGANDSAIAFYDDDDHTVIVGEAEIAPWKFYPRSQHVPVSEYNANLKAIIAEVRQKFRNAKVVIMTPPPVDEEMRKEFIKTVIPTDSTAAAGIRTANINPDRTNEEARKYADSCLTVARETNTVVLDVHAKMTQAAIQYNESVKKFLSDGLHLNDIGNEFLFREVKKEFLKLLKRKDVDKLVQQEPVDFPRWSTLADEAFSDSEEDGWKKILMDHHKKQKAEFLDSLKKETEYPLSLSFLGDGPKKSAAILVGVLACIQCVVTVILYSRYARGQRHQCCIFKDDW